MTSSIRRNIPEALNPCIKSLNYLNNVLAKAEAARQNAPEAIMLNREGYVAECTGDNIFVLKENTLITPPTSAGALEGITRNMVMEIAKNKLKLLVKEELFTPYHVYGGDEVFLTGPAAEVVPVREVDGRIIGDGAPGKITLRLMKEFRELTRLTGVLIKEGSHENRRHPSAAKAGAATIWNWRKRLKRKSMRKRPGSGTASGI